MSPLVFGGVSRGGFVEILVGGKKNGRSLTKTVVRGGNGG